MKKYIMFIALICAIILISSGSVAADQNLIPSCADSNLSVSNDAGARFDAIGNESYNYFNSTSQSATQGQNALHITTNTSNSLGNVTFTNGQSGTLYFSDTGGRGWDDNGILMLAINGTLPDNFWVHITASGYQWTPLSSYDLKPNQASLTYVSGSINETFYKSDFIYGPQIWKPCPAANYPIFAGQNMDDTTNTFSIIFIDLYAGLIGTSTSYYNQLIDNGMIRIDYEFYNLPEGSMATFNAYAYCQSSKQGEGVRWTNRVTDSGYYVNGQASAPTADFTANPVKGVAPLTVQFTDSSAGNQPFTYAWDFDNDGNVDSTEENPTYTYNTPGTYTVKLTITNAYGIDEKIMNIIVNAVEALADLPSGSYGTDKTVNLTAVDNLYPNPTIYYTLDGTDPTTSSNIYTGPINLTGEGTTTLKFFAVDSAGNISEIVTMTYTIDKTGPTATTDPVGGTYNTRKSITLTANDNLDTNPTIYYTIDGSDPRSSSTRIQYTGAFTINKTITLKFAAKDAAGNWSPVYNQTYTMVDITTPVAVADLPSGTYTSDKVVTLTATDELDNEPKIYYTTNGSTPTRNSTLYDWPIPIINVGTNILKFIAVDAAGHISNVFTNVYILNKPGASGTWNSTQIDTNIEWNSIVIDSSGNPHIAYYQKENSATDLPDLKYAYKDSAGWHYKTLLSHTQGSGRYVSLALDSAGNPHIAYYQNTPDTLWYAYKNSAGWHYFAIANNTDVSHINLLLYNDLPRISYYENTEERIKYMYYNGTNWFTESATSMWIYGHYNSLALNSNGQPRISYYEYNTTTDTGILKYTKRSPTGTWQTSTVDDSGDVGLWNSIATDSLGNPYISYNVYDGALKFAYWKDNQWVIETVDNLMSVASKILLDSSGNPRILYQDYISGNLKYAYKDDAGWHTSYVDTINGISQWISFTISPSGIPSVSYTTANSALRYANLLPFVVNATPLGGSYELVQKVTLTSTSGTTIYYTTDGKDPRTSNTRIKYTSPIAINHSTTINFAAVDSATNWSLVKTETYSITDVTGPTISANPAGGNYSTTKYVTLTTTDVNPTTTYYTTDGSDPRTSSTRIKYTSPITINTTKTLKFAAIDAVGNWGPTYIEIYDLPPTAYANSKGGLYNYNKNVRLYMNELGTIYYTLNGSTPTTSSTKYSGGPILISSTTTLKFIAVDLAGNLSPVYTEKYTIDKVRPTITSVSIKNGATGVSRTSTIVIKFSENIKTSINWNKFYIKNLSTGKTVSISKWISGNTLYLKTTSSRAAYTWYQVYIPGYSVKDSAGNNLAKGYWFKFQTGKY
ncbi:chitobiase/beta-hexosaminidase C-terminal domain-containing protein [Methanobacterium oryzae]|uniref:chitobiase/beta-hexosaminidase C-terminal domain-containing protein n=1 Tax=Methanobacterium oryzae TaxID=69540 RepID=UPI003D1CB00F